MREPTEAWRLDKHIPVAVIFTIMLQSLALVWWVSGIVNRLDNAVDQNDRQERRIESLEEFSNTQAVNSATLSAQLSAVQDSLQDLKEAQTETNRLLQIRVSDSKDQGQR